MTNNETYQALSHAFGLMGFGIILGAIISFCVIVMIETIRKLWSRK